MVSETSAEATSERRRDSGEKEHTASVIAILATHNEERFIADCLSNLIRQGVNVYLIDNCSTDRTVAIAERRLERGVIKIETLPRAGIYNWRQVLARKEELASTLDADWLMHVDADEIHLPPRSSLTIAHALSEISSQGFNAVESMEFTFVPTQEAPDHDHPYFQSTMRWYYPFRPRRKHLLRAWKQQPGPIELAWSGGHEVRFPGVRVYPEPFRMRHYLFLSVDHAIRKYVNRHYDPSEVKMGWHGWRAWLTAGMLKLPPEKDLRPYVSDDELDPADPRAQHYLDEIYKQYKRTG